MPKITVNANSLAALIENEIKDCKNMQAVEGSVCLCVHKGFAVELHVVAIESGEITATMAHSPVRVEKEVQQWRVKPQF